MRKKRIVINTDVKTKTKNWPKFEKLLRNQWTHGGDKYTLPDDPDKEVTDWVCELSPGKTGYDWILQTIAKYCGRYINFGREKDLLKIATYSFIAWLKAGYHLQNKHDEDTNRNGKRKTDLHEKILSKPQGQVEECEKETRKRKRILAKKQRQAKCGKKSV